MNKALRQLNMGELSGLRTNIRGLDMNRIANATTEPEEHEEIGVTPEMIEAEEDVTLSEIGGADLGGLFSASDLASRVYRAMDNCRKKVLPQPSR
jgi:hypothetical protein